MDSASEPTRPVTDRDLDVPALARLDEDAWEAVVSTLGPRLVPQGLLRAIAGALRQEGSRQGPAANILADP